MLLTKLLQHARNTLYTGKVRTAIHRLRIHTFLSGAYWDLLYRLSDNEKQYTIQNQKITFRTDTFAEFIRFKNFVGERPNIEDVLASLDVNDVFYDIGANVGTYTCFAASKLDNRNVIAFEPESKNVKKLKENLGINNVDAKILEVALSDTNGTIDFALTGDEAGEGEHAIATDSDSKSIQVQTARGDSIIEERGLPMPTVVKIDVEGAELSVLRGMEHVLQKSCRLVYVEVHPDKLESFNSNPSEVESILEEAGFTIKKLTQRRSEYFIKGSKCKSNL